MKPYKRIYIAHILYLTPLFEQTPCRYSSPYDRQMALWGAAQYEPVLIFMCLSSFHCLCRQTKFFGPTRCRKTATG